MKWYLDTHKYISEITRKALQIIIKHGITSQSSQEEIDAVERELGSEGVYQNYESAKGRVRRALFTYFKAYGCLDPVEQLTPIGDLYANEKLSLREFSFYYILNYHYESETFSYYPAQLILMTLKMLNDASPEQAYLTSADFSKIVECDSLQDINNEFIHNLILSHLNPPVQVNERGIGFDVWAKMLVQAGILRRNTNKYLEVVNYDLVKWILDAYELNPMSEIGQINTGILSCIPIPTLVSPTGNTDGLENEGMALQAYLFDSIDEYIINKYIANSPFSDTKKALGISADNFGFFELFKGLERLVGYCLTQNADSAIKTLGEVLVGVELSEHQLDLDLDVVSESSESNNRLVNKGENILLYGVPGSGKSNTIKTQYCDNDEYMERAVFHPDYTYSDFIGQILPKVSEEGKVTYEFEPGPFTRALKKANDDPESNYYLIVEEINRGNAPAIFGDIFQLLDRDNNGVSEYGISNEAIAAYAYGDKTKKVKIPANLFILATMNTSDQNVFTLDTAFKRRWTMKHIDNDIDACKFADHTICGNDITWGAFAKTINNLIIETNTENLSNEDNRLGAYFVKEHELDDPSCFGEKVLMYLWNDAFKYDHEKVFRSDYRTLDELIVGFKDEGMNIFVDEVDFSVATPSGTMIFEASGRDMPIDNYLAGKKNHLVAYYNELRDLVKEQVPDIRETSTASLQYAAWRADNISKASFADFQIQSERIVIFTEVPTSAAELAVGEEIPKDGHHNHYYKIIYNENEVNEIVGIIVESYEQLKKE